MKKMSIPFLCLGIAVMGLSSCGEKEKELETRESKLGEELDQKRKTLNEVVRSVDELETEDYSEKLVHVPPMSSARSKIFVFKPASRR